MPKVYSVEALKLVQGSTHLYAFKAKAKLLYRILSINERDPDKDKGYQRTLSLSRVSSIASYIDSGKPIPNCLIVALENDTKYDSSRGVLKIPDRSNSGWVIDGQHRLAGAKEASADIEILVVAFLGLDLQNQIEQFVTINREAKGVPTSLYFDLLDKLPKQMSDQFKAQERATDIAKELRSAEESLFYARITIKPPKKGELSLTNFVRKVSPLVVPNKGRLSVYSFEEQVRILENLYKALSIIFPAEFQSTKCLFYSTLGFGAIMNILPTILDLSIKHYKGFRVEDVSKLLREVQQFDFESWRQLGTGSSAEISAGNELRDALIKAYSKLHDKGTLRLS